MEAMIAGLKSVPLAKGTEEVFYPGELEARNDKQNRQDGLSLPETTLSDLASLALELEIEPLLPF
jgi:LDH2 family malate/lactate/ureidoglycolate dehydrogenase